MADVRLIEMFINRMGTLEDTVQELQKMIKSCCCRDFDLTATNLYEKRKQKRLRRVQEQLLAFDAKPPVLLDLRLDQEQINFLQSRDFRIEDPFGPDHTHDISWDVPQDGSCP